MKLDAGDAKEKLRNVAEEELGGEDSQRAIFAGTVLLLGLLLLVLGTMNPGEKKTGYTVLDDVTSVNYSSHQISRGTALKVAEAVNESGWAGSTSKIRKLNSSWYRINLSTDLDPGGRLTLDQQYKVQTTVTIIHHRAFNRSDSIILNIKANDGSMISRFVQ